MYHFDMILDKWVGILNGVGGFFMIANSYILRSP